MGRVTYVILCRTETAPADPLRAAIEASLDAGLSLSQTDTQDVFDQYRSGRHEFVQTDGGYSVDHVVEEVTQDGEGELHFWASRDYVQIRFHDISFSHGTVYPDFELTVSKPALANVDTDILVKWVKSVAERFDVSYMVGTWRDGVPDVAGTPPEELTTVPWILVLSPERVDRLGGREHVLETPAETVEELDTGQIMIVLSETPLSPRDGLDETPDEHLFGSGQ